MAVDIPTGLDCDGTNDTEYDPDQVFHADLTVSFVAAKPGMLTEAGQKFCGEIRITDIGAPPEVFDLLDL